MIANVEKNQYVKTKYIKPRHHGSSDIKRKKLSTIILIIFIVASNYSNARAWEINIGDAYNISEYWAYDITFSGDVTDNLNNINLSIGYDIEDVTFTNVQYYDYNDGGATFPSDTWNGNMIPNTNDTDLGLVYNVQGQEPLGVHEVFYPEATGQILLFTLYFQEVAGGSFDGNSVYFTYGSEQTVHAVEAVNINGQTNNNHDLDITANTISAISTVSISPIVDHSANIDTATEPIEMQLTSNQTAQVNVSATASNPSLIPNGAIAIWIDDQGTELVNPLDITAGETATLFTIVTPTGGQSGTATITMTVTDNADANKTVSTDFDLTVELAEAGLSGFLDNPTYKNTSPVTLSGNKARGSTLWLQLDETSAMEIVGTDVDGEWTYDWSLSDGEHVFCLINRAGDIEETFATGTLIVDTVPPEVPITRYYLQSVFLSPHAANDGEHQIGIIAEAPNNADSNRFAVCLDGEHPNTTGASTDYGELVTRYQSNNEVHEALVYAVDQAGNEQSGACDIDTAPLRWRLKEDGLQVQRLRIDRVQSEGQPAYVQIKWLLWSSASIENNSVRVWARSMDDTTYTEVTDTIMQEGTDWWVLDDTATTTLRSYTLTDATGSQILVDFEILDIGDTPSDPVVPVIPDNGDDGDSDGGGDGGGGCFVDTIAGDR